MTSPPDAAASNPFPGLRPFREDEEHLFFGRESQVDAMVDKLARTHFLAVVGTSGSGKSSLVNSGLRPALHRGLMAAAGTSWRIVQCRPGSQPLRALAGALAGEGGLFSGTNAAGDSLAPIVEATLRMSKLGLADIYEQAHIAEGSNLLVVVDQFEELFRYRKTDAGPGGGQERAQDAVAFVNLLLEAGANTHHPIYIALTMRSDFLGDCAQFPGLPEAINEGQYLVPRLTREERRAAIAGPIGVGGGTISPVLLTRLVNDVGDNPDQLSILQHALNRTWASWVHESQGSGPLSLSHYEAIGTMAHALDRHAEKAYAELTTERQRIICATLFKALTDRGTDARGIRRPTSVRALCALSDASQSEVAEVIAVFRKASRSFLMPPLTEALAPDHVVDISHESLMRVWERLKGWVDEEAQSAQRYRRLSETAAEHAAGKAGLLRDPELQLSLDWRDAAKPNTAWAALYGGSFEAAISFLTTSENERTRERRLQEQQQRQELEQAQALAEERARSARRLRFGLAGAAMLAVVAVGAAGWALRQRAEAQRLSAVSLARQLAAQAMLFGTEPRNDLEPAALLAVEAMTRAPNFESDRALRESTRRLAHQTQLLRHGGPVRVVMFSPDARWLATGSDDKSVRMFEAATGKELWRQDVSAGVNAAAFSADGRALAAATRDGFVRLFEAASGKALWQQSHDGAVAALAFSGDGRSVFTGGEDKTLRVFDTASGTELWRKSHTEAISMAVSAGRWIVTASGTRSRVFDAVSHEDVWNSDQQQGLYGITSIGSVRAIALSADARLLAIGRSYEFGDGGWKIVEVATGRLLSTGGAAGPVLSVALSHDGRLAAIGGAVIETETGREVFGTVRGGARSAAFSPDGRSLATAGADGIVRIVDIATGIEERLSQPGGVTMLAFDPDARHVATASMDGTARILDAHRDTAWPRLGPFEGLTRVVFSPDGRWVMTSGIVHDFSITAFGPADGWALAFEVATGRQVFKSGAVVGGFAAVDLDASRGRVNVAHYWESVVESFDISGGNTGWRRGDEAVALASSPDGRWLATGSKDGANVLDAATGTLVVRLPHDRPVTEALFSGDGRWLATSTGEAIRIFDTASRTEAHRISAGGHLAGITADGSRILTVADLSARILEVASGKELSHWTLPGSPTAWTLSSDGRWVAVTSGNSARVFETAGGTEVSRVIVGGEAQALLFVDGGRSLMVASLSPTKEILFTSHLFHPQDLIGDACARLTRNLTPEEWSQYVGSAVPYRQTCPPAGSTDKRGGPP